MSTYASFNLKDWEYLIREFVDATQKIKSVTSSVRGKDRACMHTYFLCCIDHRVLSYWQVVSM